MKGKVQAIPLGERRCTTCRRGIAEGARFRRRFPKRPNSVALVPVCIDCEAATLKARRAAHGPGYGVRPQPPARRVADLTPRQREILALVASGLKDKEIAERLGLNHQSVRSRICAIYGRLPLPAGKPPRMLAMRWYLQQRETA